MLPPSVSQEEWLDSRRGMITASNVHRIITGKNFAENENGELEWVQTPGAISYRNQVIAPALGFTLKEMPDISELPAVKRGLELEDSAILSYEWLKGLTVQASPFVKHPTLPRFGASPDGLIGDDGLVEIKCPVAENYITHKLYIHETGQVPKQYLPQIIAQLMCTGRTWCDLFIYHPEDDELPQIPKILLTDHPDLEYRIHIAVQSFAALVESTISLWRSK